MRKLLLKLSLSIVLLSSCMGNDGKPTLRFYSWNEYMDPTVISEFESENNVHVQVSYFANNEEAIAKIEQEWKQNKNTPPYDVFFPSDYMVQYMKNKGLLEKIDINQMPNVKNNILPFVINPFDKKREYTVPYTWGSIGIIYNKKFVKTPMTSWKDILEPDPLYKQKILMIDSPKELVGIALKYLGYSFNSSNKKELLKAKEILMKQSSSVLSYNGDSIQEGMNNEEAALAVSWSAEANYAMAKNPNLSFIIPKEGSNLWIDEFVILKGTKQKQLAQKLINFFYRDDIQKKNWDYMHMSLPSIRAFNALPKGSLGKTWETNKKIISKLEPNFDSDEKTKQILYNIYTSIRS